MATEASCLTYVLDENLGTLPPILRQARADGYERIYTLPEVGIPKGTLDAVLLHELGRRPRHVLVTRDSRMLNPVIQRGAWRAGGVTLFILGGKWGSLSLGEITRRLLFLWPNLTHLAEASAPGAAWRVNSAVPPALATTFRLVTA